MKCLIFLWFIYQLFNAPLFGQVNNAEWKLQTTLPGNPPLVSVKTVNRDVAWIAGFNGTIYRTVDGGKKWTSTIATNASLGCIEALDSSIAFVGDAGGPEWSGGNAKLYRTTNGGQNWEIVYTANGPNSFWDWIHFFDSQNGIAQSDPPIAGGEFLIVKTTDGGANWAPITNLPDANTDEYGSLNSGHFINELNGWFGTGNPPFVAGGTAGRVFRTTDGGNTWTPYASGNDRSVNAVRFISKDIGIRTSDTPPYLTRSTDGGQTWIEVNNLPVSNIQQTIAATSIVGKDVSQIWVYGEADAPFIISSVDNGITWQQQMISGDVQYPVYSMSASNFGSENDSVQAFAVTFDINTFAIGGQIFNYLQPIGSTAPGRDIFAYGLNSPIGLKLDKQNNLWVAEEGTGNDDSRISVITPDGKVHTFLENLPSFLLEGDPQGAAHTYFDNNGDLLIVQGEGTDSLSRSVLVISTAGFVPGSELKTLRDFKEVYNIGEFALANGAVTSNPYSLAIGPDNNLYVVDAGLNGIIKLERGTGNLTVFATFDPIQNPTDVGPPQIDIVPTGIVFINDNFYVGGFTGFPFLPGLSRIYKVDLNGNVSIFKDSLTSIVDLATDPRDNNLIALEYSEFNLDAGFLPGTGKVIKFASGIIDTLVTGLSLATGLDISASGDLFVSNFADGRVLRFNASITNAEINQAGMVPEILTLKQNYPNPFNPTTNLEFQISDLGLVTLKIYDILGREVTTLLNEEKPAGVYQVKFNAEQISSGVYFYTLSTKGFIRTKKMILMK